MKITFLGAAKEVTGSCYLIETSKTKFLVDCGMFQGGEVEEELNYQDFAFDVKDIDFILLTHAHIDHSGRIPLLYKRGYRKRIYATKGTVDLCKYMLPDSGHIQEMENEWKNRKRQRAGKPLREPLYTADEAKDSLSIFYGVDYDELIQPSSDVKFKFNDAGHMLGSSIIEVWISENGNDIKIVFSGDLGNKGTPILREPSLIKDADYVICESTYGDRLHENIEDRSKRLMEIIIRTIKRGGNVIIPSFAVGRTQELLYEIHKNSGKYQKEIEFINNVPVYVDSPLAVSVTNVFKDHLDYFDSEAQEYIKRGDYPLDFPNLHFTHSTEESKALNDIKTPVIIISASGMCEAGRIKHHLKHNLWKPENTILFVGYQAKGTLGRKLLEGEKNVKIFGEDIMVKADIEYIESFSGHADQKGIMDWLSAFSDKPKKIFIVHGEDEAQAVLSDKIKSELGIETIIPSRYDTYDFQKDILVSVELDDIEQLSVEIENKVEEMRLRSEKVLNKLQEFMGKNKAAKNLNDIVKNINSVNENLMRLYRELLE
ncbi:metallo-beta-lactamase family protein [Caldanaerobius fijiensis DSM 17918]|uniref:Metallo-beta-lactamase family protein n=1 Tax=Caldanaerobius fijiensis DSM 17918 TaxID=1121256 RepID=A0A1M5D0Y0_9THEO|nr:MBL fold metallo-hydrolase [Caldanaerobius fijiensis]SHF60462.1 metallo-beta-lactamase family protein [Caldanaerobius fijiensis DSM 17918]